MTLSESSASYLAGFIDGEGCFQIRLKKKTKGWEIRLDIVQADQPFLNKIRQETNVGGSVVKLREHNYALVFTSKQLRVLIPQILPYLRIGQEQAKIALLASQTISHRCCRYRNPAVDLEVQNYANRLKKLKPCNYAMEVI